MGLVTGKINIFNSKSACLLLIAMWIYSFWPTILFDYHAYINSGYDYQGLLVLPALALMLLRNDSSLRKTSLNYNPIGLLSLLVCATAWLFATTTDNEIMAQLAAICILLSIVLTTCGKKVISILLVPLSCLFFLLPVGHEIAEFLRTSFFQTLVRALILSNQSVYWEANKIIINHNYYDIYVFTSSFKYILFFTAAGACGSAFITKNISKFFLISMSFIATPVSLLWITMYSYVILKSLHISNKIIDGNLFWFGWIVTGIGIILASLFAIYLVNKNKPMRRGDGIDWHSNNFNSKSSFTIPIIVCTFILLSLPITAAKIKNNERFMVHLLKSKN